MAFSAGGSLCIKFQAPLQNCRQDALPNQAAALLLGPTWQAVGEQVVEELPLGCQQRCIHGPSTCGQVLAVSASERDVAALCMQRLLCTLLGGHGGTIQAQLSCLEVRLLPSHMSVLLPCLPGVSSGRMSLVTRPCTRGRMVNGVKAWWHA